MKLKPSRCGVSFLLLFFLSFTWGIALKDSPSLFWDLCTLQFKPREQTGTPHLEAAQYRGGTHPPPRVVTTTSGKSWNPRAGGPESQQMGSPQPLFWGGAWKHFHLPSHGASTVVVGARRGGREERATDGLGSSPLQRDTHVRQK